MRYTLTLVDEEGLTHLKSEIDGEDYRDVAAEGGTPNGFFGSLFFTMAQRIRAGDYELGNLNPGPK